MLFKKFPVIIDTDPGIDDAVAIALSLFSRKFDIQLICSTAGNISIDVTTTNCLNLINYFKAQVPVARGVAAPLKKVFSGAPDVHGSDGLGGVVFSKHNLKPLQETSSEEIYKVLKKNGKNGTDIWLLAPATNIALLIKNHPDILPCIRRFIMMAGTLEGVGNSYDQYNEFNIKIDPEAMKIVLDSGRPCFIIPMELGHYSYLTEDEIKKLALMNRTGAMFAEMFKNYKDTHVKHGAAMHDATVVAFATIPKSFKTRHVFTGLILNKQITVLEYSISPTPTKTVLCLSNNNDKFKKWFFKTINRMNRV